MDEPLEEWLTAIQVEPNPSSLAFKLNFPLLEHFLILFLKCLNSKGADVIMMDRWKLTSTPSSQHQPSSGRGVDRFVLVGG